MIRGGKRARVKTINGKSVRLLWVPRDCIDGPKPTKEQLRMDLNPGDPVLYEELAWMFLLKLGGPLDEAGGYYRAQWKAIVEGYEKTGELEKIGLEKARMDAVDAEYGRQDWTHPYASALYWAARGLESARKLQHRAELRQVIYQTLMMETRSEERFAARALKEMRTAYAERPSEMLLQIMVKFKATHGLD